MDFETVVYVRYRVLSVRCAVVEYDGGDVGSVDVHDLAFGFCVELSNFVEHQAVHWVYVSGSEGCGNVGSGCFEDLGALVFGEFFVVGARGRPGSLRG